MITTVFIQQQNGRLADEPDFTAWLGFKKKRYPIEFFEFHELKNGRLPLTASTLVVGSVPAVELALRQIGVPIPAPLNLPEALAAYRGRTVWTATWKDVRSRFSEVAAAPLFVKPRWQSKAFPGYVVFNAVGLAPTEHLPDDMELEVSEVVDFASEWRAFVHRQKIVGLSPYKGDCLCFPDPAVLRAAGRDYERDAPVAYGLDVGVTTAGQTLLVEVNDAYALGCYGLRAGPYAEMLEDRWRQMAGGEK